MRALIISHTRLGNTCNSSLKSRSRSMDRTDVLLYSYVSRKPHDVFVNKNDAIMHEPTYRKGEARVSGGFGSKTNESCVRCLVVLVADRILVLAPDCRLSSQRTFQTIRVRSVTYSNISINALRNPRSHDLMISIK